MLGECLRVLAPGGSYLMVTHSSPKARLQYLDKLPWDISVYEVGSRSHARIALCRTNDGSR